MSIKGAFVCCGDWALQASAFVLLGATALAQSASTGSPFRNAENLFAQHQLAEARTETLEQLKTHATVDGYNLLGIIESSQRDFNGAIEAFQHALRIKPGYEPAIRQLSRFKTVPANKAEG